MIPQTKISLKMLLTASLEFMIFATAARNIPGLLEITLLERLPLDRSVRYAIGALTRYLIVVIGTLAFGKSLGYEWQDVQWLVAALTFGLGFGLQEIFANFVSGLIILFEQPVRVGDIVTIDSVTGTVSRIRIRSTTITDWDRKEYIVPNKEFITGRLLNWTLNDTTNRIVIEVGVPFSADPNQVRSILQQIIKTQPHILAEPAPMVSLEGFGASSLTFFVRAYLPTLEHRSETIHSLYVRIHRAFGEAGIELPYPQRDLHIRSLVPIPTSNGVPLRGEFSDSVHADAERL
jgi:potassium efflux system protein